MNLLKKHKNELAELCEHYAVSQLFAFGSVLTPRFSAASDLDFLVDFDTTDPLEYTENYFNFKFALEALFQRKIDLLELRALKNEFFKRAIEPQKQLIYAGRRARLA